MAYVKSFNIKGPKGDQGIQGPKGDQGIQGPKGDQGQKGDTGAAFAITKTYASIDAMNEDFGGTDVSQGQFVMIDTGNVNDEDNAKLYVKGEKAFTYITDLSGATGLTGPQGPAGAKGDPGAQGPQGIQGPQGQKGDTGAKGDKGDPGQTGASTRVADIDVPSEGAVPLDNIHPNTNVAVGDTIIDANGDTYTITAVTDNAATVGAAITGANLKGPKGDKGDAGAKGDPGATGSKGDQGIQGPAGITPTIGENGNWFLGETDTTKPSRGAQGPQGNTGPQGETGPVGPQGPAGTAGAKGDKGDTGATGPKGDKGADGNRIYNGAGAPGADQAGIAGDMYVDSSTGDVYFFEA